MNFIALKLKRVLLFLFIFNSIIVSVHFTDMWKLELLIRSLVYSSLSHSCLIQSHVLVNFSCIYTVLLILGVALAVPISVEEVRNTVPAMRLDDI